MAHLPALCPGSARGAGSGSKARTHVHRFRPLRFYEWGRGAVPRIRCQPVGCPRCRLRRAEIYDMPTPEDAFGIYSLHVFRCQRADTLGCIDCLSPYQLQAVAGNKYVSVVFPSGSAAARSRVDELIRYYLPMDGNDNPQIPELLASLSPYSGKLKFLRGPIGISGVSTSLMHYLEGISYTGVWFIADKPSKSYRALICLREKGDAEALKKKIPAADIIQSGDDFVYLTGKEKEAEEDDHGGFGF